MTITEALSWGRDLLASQNQRALLESQILLSFTLGVERVWLHTWGDKEIEQEHLHCYQSYVKRRQNNEPIEYITQKAGFYSREFFVDSRVLIPRPETEILVDLAISLIKKHSIKRVVEIGVGSGIISISLALHYPHLQIIATDISKKALEIANHNLSLFHTQDNGLKDQITLVHTNLLQGVDGDFDLLVSNPPYIANHYPLDPCVLKEPHCALFGGNRGDEILQSIINLAHQRNIPLMVCEMGYDQKKSLQNILSQRGFSSEFYQDLSHLDRGFIAKRI